jgi:hypothetical protein
MQFLQGVLSPEDIQAIANSLNSNPATGQQRYTTACAGCHGDDARGGRVGKSPRKNACKILGAIHDELWMSFLGCLPASDITDIGSYLKDKKHAGGKRIKDGKCGKHGKDDKCGD